MIIKVPRCETVVRDFGEYPGELDLGDPRRSAVTRHIRRGGLYGWEPETQATLLSLVQLAPGPVEFLDIGAHVGMHTLLIGTVFPATHVRITDFEPTPTTADILAELTTANGVQVTLERCAMSAEAGTATLYLSDKAETSNSLAAGFRPSSKSIEVPVRTVDSYCREHAITPGVIKIDVETFEAAVLRGALDTLRSARPAVCCELLPSADPESTRQVIDAMTELGYLAHHWVGDSGWQSCPPEDVFSHVRARQRDWLFAPEPLTGRFHDAVGEWLDAISRCDASTNAYPNGAKPVESTPTRPAPNPGQDHILIVGPGKTGTTGLFASVKRGLGNAGYPAKTIFEPADARRVDNLLLYAPGVPILVKTTMDTAPKAIPEPRIFDRIAMTVRDPRDILLSSLLFRPLTVASLSRTDESTVATFVAALEAKEADPAATSMRELFELSSDLGIGAPPYATMTRALAAQQRFMELYPVHVVQYERFVRGELGDLSDYLGFAVENVSAASSSMFGYITRSKGSGEFRQWFLPEDIAFFNDMYGAALTHFGYETDVELPETQVIDPSTGSAYVRAGYDARRANRSEMLNARSARWRPTDVTSEQALGTLLDYAADGDPVACVRAAEVIASGHLGDSAGGPAEALAWARAGAELGSVVGMRMTSTLLRDQAGEDAGLHRELRKWRVAARRAQPAAKGKAAQRRARVEARRAGPAASAATPRSQHRAGHLAARARTQGRRLVHRLRREIRARR